MTDERMLPATTSTDQRLDAVIRRLDRVIDLLSPAAPTAIPDGETVELREPAKAKRRPLPVDPLLLGSRHTS